MTDGQDQEHTSSRSAVLDQLLTSSRMPHEP